MSVDSDYLVALKMQERLNTLEVDEDSDIEEVDFKKPIAKLKLSKKPLKIKRSNPHSNLDEDHINRREKLLHPQWETLDPTPDTLALFRHLDSKLFQGRLKSFSLEWSKRMYSCAGISYTLRNSTDVTIRLSEPLLKARSRKDLVETMLHQMIHAYLFLLKIRERNGGHGPNFRRIMLSINKVAGTNISTNHTFPDDLNCPKQYWWRCNGICQDRGPFFGYIQAQVSRAPDSDDQWYAQHQEQCGGTFMKIKGPEIIEKAKKRRRARVEEKENGTEVSSKLTCDAKRRCNSDQDNSIHQAKSKWVAVDEEVMLQDYHEPVITLSSDDDEDENSDTDDNCNGIYHRNMNIVEKYELIKKEIIDESIDLCDTDFELIGDVCDDNLSITPATQLAGTRTIDQFFGDDTLLVDFKRDNDCKPSSSRYQDNPDNDIIKCYICEDKLPRRDYDQHLNGCAGISKKILPHRKALKQLSSISREARPKKQTRPSAHTTRDILRNAGYSEADLARFSSVDETEEEDSFNSSEVDTQSRSRRSNSATNGSPEVLNISSEDENTIRYRQRNLYKTTRECPICNEDVEEWEMNDHLDDCLTSKRLNRST